MKQIPKFVVLAVAFLTLSFLAAGCGGGGSAGGGTTGNPATTPLVSDLQGFNGVLVGGVTQSSTPQTVQVNVGGTVRSVPNVIVSTTASAGQKVTVLLEGSKILNLSISNFSAGASIVTTSLKVPVSSQGVIGASILSTSSVILLTPPCSWSGYSIPNGMKLSFGSTNQPAGDLKVSTNAQINMASTPTASGTSAVNYTSPGFFTCEVALAASNNSSVSFNGVGQVTGVAATDGSITVPWSVLRLGNDPLVFTDAIVSASF